MGCHSFCNYALSPQDTLRPRFSAPQLWQDDGRWAEPSCAPYCATRELEFFLLCIAQAAGNDPRSELDQRDQMHVCMCVYMCVPSTETRDRRAHRRTVNTLLGLVLTSDLG